MLTKQAAIKQIADKLEQVDKLIAESNAIAMAQDLNYEDEYDVDYQKEEEFDPFGTLSSLRGWNASTC